MAKKAFEVGDRVLRIGVEGPLGTINKIRKDTIRTSIKEDSSEPPGVTISVLWDNGTLSHFVPDGLELAQTS